MSGEFLGTYENSVNKGKWITIPATFKKRFSAASKEKVVVTIGHQNNIVIYPLDNWTEKKNALRASGTQRSLILLTHLINFASTEQKMEINGRIKLSSEQLEIANIKDKVIIKGEGNFITVLNPEQYKEFRAKTIKKHMEMFTAMDYQT